MDIQTWFISFSVIALTLILEVDAYRHRLYSVKHTLWGRSSFGEGACMQHPPKSNNNGTPFAIIAIEAVCCVSLLGTLMANHLPPRKYVMARWCTVVFH
jgi:hypothetical protein